MKYGYVGLGNLGGHIAMSLIKAGHQVVVYDRNPALAERHVAAGAVLASSVSDLAGQVDHVFTCLPSPAVSELVLAEMLITLKPGATWIENSTIGRDDIIRLGGLAKGSGIRLLEAPVTGGVHLAARGEFLAVVHLLLPPLPSGGCTRRASAAPRLVHCTTPRETPNAPRKCRGYSATTHGAPRRPR